MEDSASLIFDFFSNLSFSGFVCFWIGMRLKDEIIPKFYYCYGYGQTSKLPIDHHNNFDIQEKGEKENLYQLKDCEPHRLLSIFSSKKNIETKSN